MDIFSIVLNSLTSENEVLLNFLMVPFGILEIFLIIFLSKTLFDYKIKINYLLPYTYIIVFSTLLTVFIIPQPYNVIFNVIILILASKFIFKITFFKSGLSILTSCFIFNIVSMLYLNPFLDLFQISTLELQSIPMYRIPFIISLHTLIVILAFLLRFKNFKLLILEDLDQTTKISIFIHIFLGISAIVLQTILISFFIELLPSWATALSIVSLVGFFAMSLVTINRIFKLKITTQKLQVSESYNQTLQTLHDSVRGFKHDFDNTLTTIGGYILTKDLTGLDKYYKDLVQDSKQVNNLYILNPDIINNDGLYNLLLKKYHEACSKDLEINFTILFDLSELNMKTYEFCRILGILIDNAIEASESSNERIIDILFRKDFKANKQIVLVENSYSNKDVNLSKIYEKGLTSKKEHTGLGLWEVKKILSKYTNCIIKTTKNETLFIQRIEIT